MKFVTDRLAKWIQAAIIITVGILCIVAGAKIGSNDYSQAKDALDAISLTLGIVLVVVGTLSLVLSCLVAILAKKGFLAAALPGGVLLALGISLLPTYNHYAGDLILLLLRVVPFVMIVLGAIIVLGGGFNLFNYFKNKGGKGELIAAIVIILVGAIALVLGALCVGENPVIPSNVQLVIFGIIVALEGCLQFLLTFIKAPDVVVFVKEENK